LKKNCSNKATTGRFLRREEINIRKEDTDFSNLCYSEDNMFSVYHKDFFRFSIFYVYFFLVLVQFVLHCFAESITRRGYYELNTKQCLEVESSFLSRLTFWWMTGLIIIGYKKPLEEADISDLHPRDKSDVVIPTFEEAWKKEYAKHEKIREYITNQLQTNREPAATKLLRIVGNYALTTAYHSLPQLTTVLSKNPGFEEELSIDK
ncbi:multidrug 1 resistance-associated protein, partial [Mytilus galloprovincialis]